jgi:hypothetical protein
MKEDPPEWETQTSSLGIRLDVLGRSRPAGDWLVKR